MCRVIQTSNGGCMKLPTMEELYKFYATIVVEDPGVVFTATHEFNLEVARYHGANSILNLLHKQLGDDPAIAVFIRDTADELNANMAEVIGG